MRLAQVCILIMSRMSKKDDFSKNFVLNRTCEKTAINNCFSYSRYFYYFIRQP